MKLRLRSHKRFFELTAYIAVTSAFCLVAALETGAVTPQTQTDTKRIDFFPTSLGAGGLIPVPGVSDQLRVPAGLDSWEYETQRFVPDVAANAIGVRLTGDSLFPEQLQLTLTVYNGGKSVTHPLPPIVEDAKQALPTTLLITSPVSVAEYDAVSVHVQLMRAGEISPSVDSMEVISVDSTAGTLGAVLHTPEASADGSLNVVSRKGWGADESYRFTKDREEKWPQQVITPEVFIVHHTAGSDGGDDPAATIRSLYFWHSTVLGWGDIGYNFIIDQDGVVYKGRAGELGVVGGHTYNSDTNTNYNIGSVGIVLLGCFEEEEGACPEEHGITAEIEESLGRLIGEKAATLNVNPTSTVAFFNEETPRVLGHRDLDATYCPGSDVHDNLSQVRSLARSTYTSLTRVPYKGSFEQLTLNNQTVDDAAIELQLSYTATVRYVNAGKKTWRQTRTALKLYNGSGRRPTRLADAEWPDRLGRIPMNEEVVAPGESATFTFQLLGPQLPSTKKITTKLFHGKSKVVKSNKKIPLRFSSDFAVVSDD